MGFSLDGKENSPVAAYLLVRIDRDDEIGNMFQVTFMFDHTAMSIQMALSHLVVHLIKSPPHFS